MPVVPIRALLVRAEHWRNDPPPTQLCCLSRFSQPWIAWSVPVVVCRNHKISFWELLAGQCRDTGNVPGIETNEYRQSGLLMDCGRRGKPLGQHDSRRAIQGANRIKMAIFRPAKKKIFIPSSQFFHGRRENSLEAVERSCKVLHGHQQGRAVECRPFAPIRRRRA
ncbi:hypothetical protein CCP2SC5_2770002 [Azospirillaceae bacterium]